LVKAGTYLVGDDIQPGVYRGQAGFGLFDSCYWQRLKDLSGDFESIIANDNGVGQFYVGIEATDTAFQTDCDMTRLDPLPSPVGEFPMRIEPGMYLIGIDIAAGRYKGEAGADVLDSCYWERLSGVTGDFSAILANDNANNVFYVQVRESDFALKTECALSLEE
jgi:hypothetical protein